MVCVAALSYYNFAQRDDDDDGGDYIEYNDNNHMNNINEKVVDDISGMIVDRIRAMRRQEETYRILKIDDNDSDNDEYQYRRRPCTNNSNNYKKKCIDDIGDGCRTKLCQWFYSVADACGLSREIVAITMSYVDRLAMVSLLSSSCIGNSNSSSIVDTNFKKSVTNINILESKSKYQLANMTCLYMAMKLHETVTMDISALVELGKGMYSPDDFQNMEREILSAFQWKMNEPTPLAFVRCYLQLYEQMLLLQSSVSVNKNDKNNASPSSKIKQIMSHAKYQTEIAVAEISLFGYRPSELALAAITNSMIHFDMINDVTTTYLLSLRDMIDNTITAENATSSTTNAINNSKTTALALSLRVSKLQNSLTLLLLGVSSAGTPNDNNHSVFHDSNNREQSRNKQQILPKKERDTNNVTNDNAEKSSIKTIKRSMNHGESSPVNVSARKLI